MKSLEKINTIGIVVLIASMTFGYCMLTIQRSDIDKLNNEKQQRLKRDSINNAKMNKVYRDFYHKYALISKDDECDHVKEHISKKHTTSGKVCKTFKGFK